MNGIAVNQLQNEWLENAVFVHSQKSRIDRPLVRACKEGAWRMN